jgi:hypothetical protein
VVVAGNDREKDVGSSPSHPLLTRNNEASGIHAYNTFKEYERKENMFDRKEYDRKRAKEMYDVFKARRDKLLKEQFGDQCFLCYKKTTKGRPGMHLHHLFYGDESNYPKNGKLMAIRIKRVEEAEQFPERFKLLCPRCHRMVESLKALPNLDFDKILEAIGTYSGVAQSVVQRAVNAEAVGSNPTSRAN